MPSTTSALVRRRILLSGKQEWIDALPDRGAYLEHLGAERWSGLGIAEHRFAAPVDYGY